MHPGDPDLTGDRAGVPTMIESGDARPSAHGQAMTNTATADTSASVSAGAGPTTNQTVKVAIAMTITTGTKYAGAASASRWIGAFEACAAWTILMICVSMVSAPTLAARTRREPVVLTVAPMTVSPACLVTGMGSPVTIDSSTADCPDRTVASMGCSHRAGSGPRRRPRPGQREPRLRCHRAVRGRCGLAGRAGRGWLRQCRLGAGFQ